MNWFKNLKIQGKLIIAFIIPILLLVILTVFTICTMNSVNKRQSALFEGPIQRLSYASDAVREISNIRRCILFMGYLAEGADAAEQYYKSYEESARLVLENLDSYYENLESEIFLTAREKEDRKAALSRIMHRFDIEYRNLVNEVYRASLNGDRRQVDEQFLRGIPLGDDITRELDELRAMGNKFSNDIISDTQAYSSGAVFMVAAIAACIIILSLFSAAIMSRAIKSPIISIKAAVEEISKGNLAYPVRSGCDDELGILSNSIGDMVDTISTLNKTVAILDNLDDVIFVTDLDYNLIYINKKAAEVYGSDKKLSLNFKCYNSSLGCKSAAGPCPHCPAPGLLEEKKSFPSADWEREVLIGGKKVWFACKTSIIRWVDGSQAMIHVLKDNTLRKEHDRRQARHEDELRRAAFSAEESLRLKSAFLANMSHEIRTPMNGIIGFAELAMDGGISPVTRDYLRRIKESSEGLLKIINDILDISKIEAGKISLEAIPFDVHEVFRICQSVSTPKALEKGIVLYCYSEPVVDRKLLGDPTRLRQALLNLLSNAVKFTNTGIVKLLSAVNKTSGDSITMHFEVQDSGIGMNPEQISRIFDPFMQADDTMTRKYGGTGLGLSITKSIIELMGGELTVESAPGAGSKFSFDLTFNTIDVHIEDSESFCDTDEIERPVFEGEVLICEDNAMNQQVLMEHLKRAGLEASIAVNGKECVDTVRARMENGEKAFDLIFMDIHMPVMDGLEASGELMKIGNTSPVVAITASVLPYDGEAYKAYGMPDYVSKPFTSRELWSCLLRHLTPLYVKAVNEETKAGTYEKMHNQLLISFWRDNRSAFERISGAVHSGNMKLAYRQVHTLKGVAGLIGKTVLQQCASNVERSLAARNPDLVSEHLKALKHELNAVLTELADMFGRDLLQTEKTETGGDSPKEFNMARVSRLFEKLEPLLKASNTDCLDFIGELAVIPGTGEFIDQLERFDFASARKTLALIKRNLECAK